MWLEQDKHSWLSCFSFEVGEQIEKYCQAGYGWLVWRGNHYEERTTDGVLILTNARIIFVSRTGVFKKSYLWNHSVGYKGILGLSTGGWLRKHLAIQAKFKRKRKIDTLKYYIQPSDLIPEYEKFIREKWEEPLQVHKTPEKKECPECGKPVSSDFNLCPYCGAKLGN